MTEEELRALGRAAKGAAGDLARLSEEEKNSVLSDIADALEKKEEALLAANAKDIEKAPEYGLSAAMTERLTVSKKRIAEMAEGLRQLVKLDDPCHKILSRRVLPNGLELIQETVPFGVIAMIYESRPNVTVDAAALCIKSGNACLLRGGKEAHFTNAALTELIQDILEKHGVRKEAVSSVLDPNRALMNTLLSMKESVDLAIPRGGAKLIRFVTETARVPVIETGSGICHTYIDKAADPAKAVAIAVNAKTQRPSVCNAMETLLIHKDIAPTIVPELFSALRAKGVEIRGDEAICALDGNAIKATEEDWATEYGDLILSVRVVADVKEAAAHIARYGTKHSECIVSEDKEAIRWFMNAVDAACVYANASTRFTDGFEFGLGAEIGISTQKLHVRGPVALAPLVTYKYKIFGNGQIRG